MGRTQLLLGEGWVGNRPELPCDAAGTEGSGAEEGDKWG